MKRSCPDAPVSVIVTRNSLKRYKASEGNANICRRSSIADLHWHGNDVLYLIFDFLNVIEHETVKKCCKYWKAAIKTLPLSCLNWSLISKLNRTHVERGILSTMYQNYSSVKQINFTGQRYIMDQDLLVITSCFWANLQEIIVDDCIELTDFSLLSILNANSCAFSVFSMKNCKKVIGDIERSEITGTHSSLRYLDFTNTRISYTFVEFLEHVFPSLQTIRVLHTPAHLQFLQHNHWNDLVDELKLLIVHKIADIAQFNALLQDFSSRLLCAREKFNSVLDCSLLMDGMRLLLNVPLDHDEYCSPLLVACDQKLEAIVDILLDIGQQEMELSKRDGSTALCLAIANKLAKIVPRLIDAGANVNHHTHGLATPMHIAAETNQVGIVKHLLQCHAQMTMSLVSKLTPLCVAAKHGHQDVVSYFLLTDSAMKSTPRRYQDLIVKHKQALFLACEEGHLNVLINIVKATNIDVNILMDDTVSMLYIACQLGHYYIAKYLLGKGAKANFARPQNGVSCLYIASQNGHLYIVQLLVHYGVNVHAQMADMSTALHITTRMGNFAIIELLLRCGANTNALTASNLTPLHIASEEGYYEIAQLLIQHGAKLDHQTDRGSTALHIASQRNFPRIVQLLLLSGANVQLANHNGTYPMDIALLVGNIEISHMLLQYRAKVGRLNFLFAEKRRNVRLQGILSSSSFPHSLYNDVLAVASPKVCSQA